MALCHSTTMLAAYTDQLGWPLLPLVLDCSKTQLPSFDGHHTDGQHTEKLSRSIQPECNPNSYRNYQWDIATNCWRNQYNSYTMLRTQINFTQRRLECAKLKQNLNYDPSGWKQSSVCSNNSTAIITLSTFGPINYWCAE